MTYEDAKSGSALPEQIKRSLGHLMAHGTYLQEEAREKSFEELVREIETHYHQQLEAKTPRSDGKFLNKFKELKKQRNNHLIDEPDFDEAVEQLMQAEVEAKVAAEVERRLKERG